MDGVALHLAKLVRLIRQRLRIDRPGIGDDFLVAIGEAQLALGEVARHFTECIRTGRAPLTDGRSGVRILRILEAVDQSIAAHGALVPLNERARRDAAAEVLT